MLHGHQSSSGWARLCHHFTELHLNYAPFPTPLVSYPTRWSLLFILWFLYGSSDIPPSEQQRNIVQLCTTTPHTPTPIIYGTETGNSWFSSFRSCQNWHHSLSQRICGGQLGKWQREKVGGDGGRLVWWAYLGPSPSWFGACIVWKGMKNGTDKKSKQKIWHKMRNSGRLVGLAWSTN